MRRIEIYDTTLRDGSQGEGVNFSLQDKLLLTERLDSLGFDYIEGGYPLSNDKDAQYFQRVGGLSLSHARVCAFGMTRRKGVTADHDPGMKALVDAGAKIITLVGKTWDFHVTEVLSATLDENVEMIADSVAYLRRMGCEVIYDAEHFFDGWKANPEYARRTIQAAGRGGRPDGRAVRHQRRQPAREDCRADARGARVAEGAGRHPLPQRLRTGRREFVSGHRCRGRPCAGDDQWRGRAVRQCRPGHGGGKLGAEEIGVRSAAPPRA